MVADDVGGVVGVGTDVDHSDHRQATDNHRRILQSIVVDVEE